MLEEGELKLWGREGRPFRSWEQIWDPSLGVFSRQFMEVSSSHLQGLSIRAGE